MSNELWTKYVEDPNNVHLIYNENYSEDFVYILSFISKISYSFSKITKKQYALNGLHVSVVKHQKFFKKIRKHIHISMHILFIPTEKSNQFEALETAFHERSEVQSVPKYL